MLTCKWLWLLFSCLVMSDSLRLPGLQFCKFPCPLLPPRVCPTHVYWVNNTIQSSHFLPYTSPPPSILSNIKVLPNESVFCLRWPKNWSFNISPSSKHSGLISFKIEWFDLLAAQGTLKSRLQHHCSKASNLWCSDFFCGPPLTWLLEKP